MTEEEKEEVSTIESKGFIKNNNYHITEIEVGKRAVMEAEITNNSLNPYEFAHGGFIFGLGDTAMGFVAGSTGKKPVTISSSISYLRPTIGKKIKAVAEMIKDGKKTSFLRCNFYDENDKLTATMDANYYYID